MPPKSKPRVPAEDVKVLKDWITQGAKLWKNAVAGGSSRLSVGSINAAGSSLQQRAGIADSPGAHFEDMDHFMGPFAAKENRELRRLLVDHAAETLAWLTSLPRQTE